MLPRRCEIVGRDYINPTCNRNHCRSANAHFAEAVDEGLALGCETGNAQELAEVMAGLCDDPELRDEMSRKADIVRKVDDCAEHIEQIYDLALAHAEAVGIPPEPPGVSLVIPRV